VLAALLQRQADHTVHQTAQNISMSKSNTKQPPLPHRAGACLCCTTHRALHFSNRFASFLQAQLLLTESNSFLPPRWPSSLLPQAPSLRTNTHQIPAGSLRDRLIWKVLALHQKEASAKHQFRSSSINLLALIMKNLQVFTTTGSTIELGKNLHITAHNKFFSCLYTDITTKSILRFLPSNLSPQSSDCF